MDKRAWTNAVLYEALPPITDGITQYRRRTDGMRCILLPAADVNLGSDAGTAEPDERPRRRVHLPAFLIDAEPVSVTAYARFLNSLGKIPESVLREWFLPADGDHRAGHLPLVWGIRGWRPVKGTERKPMMLVSWFGANAYSLWANRRDWRTYRGDGLIVESVRSNRVAPPRSPTESYFSLLPSEAEWEYAASGADCDQTACVARHEPGAEYTAEDIPSADVNEPLGVSSFGLHHMAGNVWQWCRDWYSPGIRSERGGSWVGPAKLSRSSYRRGRVPEARGRCLGFRCVGVVNDLSIDAGD